MDNSKTLQVIIVLKAIEAFLGGLNIEGITVHRNQSGIFFTGLDAKRLGEAKALAYEFAKNHSPDRVYKHFKIRGFKTWRTEANYLRCGLRIVRTENETKSIVLGYVVGVDC